MKKPQISLIITTYNRPDALAVVIKSAIEQIDLPDEIIVADDGSGEETRKVVEQYRQISPVPLIHCWHEDLGFRLAAIRNRAIAMARYEYIVMIDGDIVLPRHFIKSHRKHARPGFFIQGSRVMLGDKLTHRVILTHQYDISVFSLGIKSSRFNALYIPFLSGCISYPVTSWQKVRGCNQAYWRDDVLKINGFNEDFIGWGREDSEFMVRMQNAGIKCLKVKMEAYGYHLYHPESCRKMEQKNHDILEDAIRNKSVRCTNGISKYLVETKI